MKTKPKIVERDIPQLTDFCGPIGDLVKIAKTLQRTYGDETIVKFDAGYNNISCCVELKAKI